MLPDLNNGAHSDDKIAEVYLKLQESQTIGMVILIA